MRGYGLCSDIEISNLNGLAMLSYKSFHIIAMLSEEAALVICEYCCQLKCRHTT